MSIILLLITFSLFTPGEFQTAHPPQLIEVQEGDTATIQCQTHHGISLEKYTLDVKRVDCNSSDPNCFVYSRRHGKDHPVPQMERYRNRVVLISEDLKKEVVTLVIRSVQPADSGRYKCYIPKLNFTSFSTIVVKDKRNGTKETDFSTRTTSIEEMTDESETGAATKEHQRHRVLIIAVTISAFCLLVVGVVVVFMVLFKKGIWMSKKKSEGNDLELETLSVPAKEGDEEGQLKKPSAGGVGGQAG